MQKKIKKTIAREFLIFLVCVSIGGIVFLSIYPYNYYIGLKADQIEKEIIIKKNISDSLATPYNKKSETQSSFASKFIFTFYKDNPFTDVSIKIWPRLAEIAHQDSIKYKWEHTWDKDMLDFTKKYGGNNPESFKKFILDNLVNAQDQNSFNNAKVINNEISLLQIEKQDMQNKIVYLKNQFKTCLIAFLISILLLFGLRYIVYGIKWSFKTLKEN